MQYQTFDRFYGQAKSLRSVFDRRFKQPLHSHPERFQWDYWHVPGEYTLLRTPAYTYFPKKVYERFHRHLVAWGREHLGCHDISPPWLSCYIEGCRQEPHQDVPHGPLAFVYSLTPWKGRPFTGGETFLKPNTRIAPEFNRLTIFNPAIVHGVRPVKGTHDPRYGRLVVHGWFVNPRPFWVGPLRIEDVRQALEEDLQVRPNLNLGKGFLSLRLDISAAGHVQQTPRILVNTLQKATDLREFTVALKQLKFPKCKTASRLTLPFLIGD
ncbi:MAG: 2OG-Fe(II) oxygenase [Bdellovibrionales bacterium]|nr:2OG-Fe(II) oxygenase [Bdellovibrionales bacterium]